MKVEDRLRAALLKLKDRGVVDLKFVVAPNETPSAENRCNVLEAYLDGKFVKI